MKTPVLALITDYGAADGRAAKLVGAVKRVDPSLRVCETQNSIPKGDVLAASAYLYTAFNYFPPGAIAAVVVGADGKGCGPLAARARDGKTILAPDNGVLTIWLEANGLDEVRAIENVDCPAGSDLYAHTEALLASGAVSFEELGARVALGGIRRLPTAPCRVGEGSVDCGIQSVLANFGNLNLSVPIDSFLKSGIAVGDGTRVTITMDGRPLFDSDVVYARSFGHVGRGAPALFNGSSGYMGMGLNQESFLEKHIPELLGSSDGLSRYRVSIRRIRKKGGMG